MILLEDLRSAIKPQPNEEPGLEAMRLEVIGQWEQATGYLWSRRTNHVEVFGVDASVPVYEIRPALRPIVSVSLVEESDDGDEWTETAGGWAVLDGAIRRFGQSWSRWVRITLTGGYVGNGDTPAEIRYALLVQARFLRARVDATKVSVSSQNFEGGGGVYHRPDYHPAFEAAVRPRARYVG